MALCDKFIREKPSPHEKKVPEGKGKFNLKREENFLSISVKKEVEKILIRSILIH